MADLCGQSRDIYCFEKVRREILDGVDRSNKVSVNRSNSLENRLVKVLLYLHNQHPDEGWLNYLDGNALKWSSMIFAGHSQGGGETALIAKRHRVARAVMFASPSDYSTELNAFAPWQSATHATPIKNYYGFAHVNDPISADLVLPVWELLGMNVYGNSVSVDGTLAPYNKSHELTTAATPVSSGDYSYHNSLVVDTFTPKLSDNTPMFKTVWQYLCFSGI